MLGLVFKERVNGDIGSILLFVYIINLMKI
jgi:hypothetical protein